MASSIAASGASFLKSAKRTRAVPYAEDLFDEYALAPPSAKRASSTELSLGDDNHLVISSTAHDPVLVPEAAPVDDLSWLPIPIAIYGTAEKFGLQSTWIHDHEQYTTCTSKMLSLHYSCQGELEKLLLPAFRIPNTVTALSIDFGSRDTHTDDLSFAVLSKALPRGLTRLHLKNINISLDDISPADLKTALDNYRTAPIFPTTLHTLNMTNGVIPLNILWSRLLAYTSITKLKFSFPPMPTHLGDTAIDLEHLLPRFLIKLRITDLVGVNLRTSLPKYLKYLYLASSEPQSNTERHANSGTSFKDVNKDITRLQFLRTLILRGCPNLGPTFFRAYSSGDIPFTCLVAVQGTPSL